MPQDVSQRRARAEMGPRLRTVVEPENRFDHAVPFRGQVDSAGAASIGAAGMRHVVELDAERSRELRDGPGQNDRPSRRMLLDHGKTLRFSKRTDPRDIRRVRAMIAGKILFAQMSDRLAGGEARHARLAPPLPPRA